MASIISAGTTSGTALNISGDTSGNLAFQTQAGTYTVTVPNETGTILTNKTTGTVLQVVNGSYSTEVSTTSGTPADTGLTATITPKFSTSKILVLVSQKVFSNNDAANSGGANMFLLRGSTTLFTANRVAFSDGTGAMDLYFTTSYLDSPATTSATTYKTQVARYGGSGTVFVQITSCISGITLMEIAA
jgi:hypothetical protein